MKYTGEKPTLMSFFNVPRFDVPELLRTPEESKPYHEVWLNVSDLFCIVWPIFSTFL
jgi:NADH dehydrogenase (ubiquinone) 1 alpha subcomplex subunit 10